MSGWADQPLRDDEVAAQLAADLDKDDLALIHGAYGADIRLRAGQLRDAVMAGNADQAYRAAHSLKGASLNLGFLRLGQLSAHLQGLAQAGDMAALAVLWDGFAGVCDDTLALLGDSGLAFVTDSSIVRP